jgi:hypothetical protein
MRHATWERQFAARKLQEDREAIERQIKEEAVRKAAAEAQERRLQEAEQARLAQEAADRKAAVEAAETQERTLKEHKVYHHKGTSHSTHGLC